MGFSLHNIGYQKWIARARTPPALARAARAWSETPWASPSTCGGGAGRLARGHTHPRRRKSENPRTGTPTPGIHMARVGKIMNPNYALVSSITISLSV